MRRIAVISDFDGTVSKRDIGHHFFGTFIEQRASWLKLLNDWRLGLISSRECLEKELALSRADLDDLERFVDAEEIDPYFDDFVDFCMQHRLELLIASDGLDRYVSRFLVRHSLGSIPFRANRLINSGKKLEKIEFPYFDLLDCRQCGNCKLWHLEKVRSTGALVIYVGNGYSDRCPAEHADFVLAKGELLDHCKERKIQHARFENFRDVELEITSRFIINSGSLST